MKILKLSLILLLFFVQYGFGQTTIVDLSNISGHWTLANSPYIIKGRAIVPFGQSLTIDPGVEIKLKSSPSSMSSWFSYSSANVGVIRVHGEIIANGTATNPIKFTRDSTGYWGAILIDEDADTNSSFTHCIIEFAKETRDVTGITSVIAFDAGICLYKSSITLNNNEIRDNGINGIYIKEVSTLVDFSNNNIKNNAANGVVIEGSTAKVINNVFYNNSNNYSGYVSAIRSSNSNVYLVNNLIYNNDDFGIFTTNGGNNYIVNNTIYGNSQGIRVENGANTYIHSSIIQNNTLNFTTSSTGGAIVEMSYSLTNSASFPANVTNNSGNILASNAIFTNSSNADFSLLPTSPCINTGNPSTTGLNLPILDLRGNPRIDNGRIDMGAIEYQQPIVYFQVTTTSNPLSGGNTTGSGSYVAGSMVTVDVTPSSLFYFLNWTENGTIVSSQASYSFAINANRNLVANFFSDVGVEESELATAILRIYPNPVTSLLVIEMNDFYFAEVFDIQGNFVLSSVDNTIDMQSLASGVYLFNIYPKDGIQVNRRIVKE